MFTFLYIYIYVYVHMCMFISYVDKQNHRPTSNCVKTIKFVVRVYNQ
jgi:hypothetical protein